MEDSFIRILFQDPHRVALISAIIAGAIGAFLIYRTTQPPASMSRRIVMGILRFIAITGIVFMLADPILMAYHKKAITPSVVLLIDNSCSMTITDGYGNRKEQVESVIDSRELADLRSNYPIHSFSFSESLYYEERTDYSGISTALGDAISAVLDTAQELEIGAIVIISDGQSNIGSEPISIAALSPVPIYTIGIGDHEPSPDVSVAQIMANPIAYAGENLPVVAHIRAWRIAGKRANVSIWEGKTKLGEQQVELPKSGQIVPLKFDIESSDAGTHYYTVRIPRIGNEVSTSNNMQSVAVKVLPSRKRILIACEHLSWEVAFWRRALEKDPHIDTDLFVARGGGDARITKFPTDTSALSDYHALVLIHTSGILTMGAASTINKYVRNGGSILWLIDDWKISSASYETLSEIMTVEIPSGAEFITDEFVPFVAADGYSHPILRVVHRTEDLSNSIAGMPPLGGFIPASAKPDAFVLLSHPENGSPILAVGESGGGRCAIICGASFWKWAIVPAGFGQDTHIFYNLARNLMQFLLAKEKISHFVLRAGKKVYHSGEPVVISASLRDKSNQPLSGANIMVDVSRNIADSIETFSVELTEAGAGIYETRLPSLAPGKYKIFGNAEFQQKNLGKTNTSLVVEEYELEFAQTNQDRSMLQLIANISGGRYFPADSLSGITDAIELPTRIRTWTTERELWNSIWLLIIVTACFATEWFLRKRANLL